MENKYGSSLLGIVESAARISTVVEQTLHATKSRATTRSVPSVSAKPCSVGTASESPRQRKRKRAVEPQASPSLGLMVSVEVTPRKLLLWLLQKHAYPTLKNVMISRKLHDVWAQFSSTEDAAAAVAKGKVFIDE
eukprot:RCo044276